MLESVADIDQFVDTMSYVLAEFGRQISALKDKKTAEDYRMQHRFGTDMEILNLVRKLMEADAGCGEDADALLKKVHEWGKSGNNMLSRLDKASKGAALDVDQRHPGYLLRRDLVRIIGNMSFRNKENQDLVRTVGGIPLILEQAVIDDRNPFITQWTEMAVRNLCEGNLENVKVIKDLKIQGIANPTELLNRFGVTVDVDGERVVFVFKKPFDIFAIPIQLRSLCFQEM
nr:hypothetical protein BaRGS_028166 [Batillaria attramentaria]